MFLHLNRSALAAFKNRILYANVSYDRILHMKLFLDFDL